MFEISGAIEGAQLAAAIGEHALAAGEGPEGVCGPNGRAGEMESLGAMVFAAGAVANTGLLMLLLRMFELAASLPAEGGGDGEGQRATKIMELATLCAAIARSNPQSWQKFAVASARNLFVQACGQGWDAKDIHAPTPANSSGAGVY